MDKLRCGVIFTQAFADHLLHWWSREPLNQTSCVPSLEYFACKEGPRKGEQWLNISWTLLKDAPDHELFRIGAVPVHLGRSTQRALKLKCLDMFHGSIAVRGGG